MGRRLAITMAAMMWTAGCGGGGGGSTGGAGTGGGGPAGVDGTKLVSDATDADRTAACGWFASMLGGYGAQPTCGDAPLNAPASEADCLASFPSCGVTFADFEACVTAIVTAQKQCTTEAIQSAEASDACAAVIPAKCFGN